MTEPESISPFLWRWVRTYKLAAEVRRPTMEILTELVAVADDLAELGDNATAALVREAIDRFMAWKFGAGEQLLERALEERRQHEQEPLRSPYFNSCVLAII